MLYIFHAMRHFVTKTLHTRQAIPSPIILHYTFVSAAMCRGKYNYEQYGILPNECN